MFVDLQTKCLGGTTLFHNHKTKSEALKLSENNQVSAIPSCYDLIPTLDIDQVYPNSYVLISLIHHNTSQWCSLV